MIPSEMNLGPVTVHVYGLIIGVAVVTAGEVGAKIYHRHQGRVNQFWSAFAWAIVFGLIGSRLYHVIDQWQYYKYHWSAVVAVWNGGLGIWGGILGGVLGIIIYAWIVGDKKVLGRLLDAAAITVPLGQAIGRWGNYVNQELFGKLTKLPWGITINHKPGRYHPLFLYESILLFSLFGLLLWLEKRRVFKWGVGGYLGVYLVGYGLIRLTLEPLRIEMWRLMGLPTASLISGLMIILGAVLAVKARKVR